jgi:hypothetical protein
MKTDADLNLGKPIGSLPPQEAGLCELNWEDAEFRLDAPPEKARTVRMRFVKVPDYPFETRPDPRD